MVAIAPFRALRYNLERVGDVSEVIAPPYDVISPDQQDRLYQRSPHNIVRLILGKQFPDDRHGADRYSRAKDTLAQWRQEQVLIRDPSPAIYVIEHQFTWDGQPRQRVGFIGLLQFEGSLPGQVYGHEATFDAPKADRTQLLDAVRAHLSPVFCILPDPHKQIERVLDEVRRQPPAASGEAQFGQSPTAARPDRLRVWVLREPGAIAQIQQAAAAHAVLIADGHHRFAVALSRRALCPAVMTYFARLDDPALIVRGYHRVVALPDAATARLEQICRITPVADRAALLERLNGTSGPGQFGLYRRAGWALASVRPEALAGWLAAPSVPAGLASLDVSILHHWLLPELGVPGASASTIRYTPDPGDAASLVDRGEGRDWAWLLRPIPVPEIFALSKQGLMLPQKSTYFYPKVLSGLVINAFDDAPASAPAARVEH